MRFRRQALRHLEAPEQLDQVVRLASPQAWLLAGALVVLIAAATGWACVGRVARTVGAPGVLIHEQGVSGLDATQNGAIVKVWTARNNLVSAGSPLYTVRTASGQLSTVDSTWDAYVVAFLVSEGDVVAPGTQVAALERVTGPAEPLVAAVLVPAASAPMLSVGRPVQLTAPAAPASAFGTLSGVVSSVGAFPETSQSLQVFLGSSVDTQKLLGHGSVVRVIITLNTVAGSATTLRWSKAAPSFQLNSESAVQASFTVSDEHPISWLLGS